MTVNSLITIKMEIHIGSKNEHILLETALKFGFSRDHPNRQWTPAEKKRAHHFAIRALVTDTISKHQSQVSY